MEHPAIDEDDVVERYLRGRLPAEEAQAFERHYLACPNCLDQLEAGADFAAALRRTAAQGLLDPPKAKPPAQKVPAPAARWLALAALLLAALALAFLAGRASFEGPAPEPAGLQAQLLPVFLGAVRSAAGAPPVELKLAPEIESVLLIYELPASEEGSGYRLALRREGNEFWRSGPLAANDLGLAVAVPRHLLPTGDYELEATAGETILGRAAFRVP